MFSCSYSQSISNTTTPHQHSHKNYNTCSYDSWECALWFGGGGDVACGTAFVLHPGFVQTEYVPLPSPYLYHSQSHPAPHIVGAPTMPQTKRSHRDSANLKFSSIHRKKIKIYKIIKPKKYTFCSANAGYVYSLHFGQFPCPASPLQSHVPVLHIPFSQQFLLAQVYFGPFTLRGPRSVCT